MIKYLDKEKLINFLNDQKQQYSDAILDNNTLNQWETINALGFILENLNLFEVEIPKTWENSVHAQYLRQDFKEQSRTWLDDEYIDLKNEWISNQVEEILIETDKNNIEFLEEIIEMIIDETN